MRNMYCKFHVRLSFQCKIIPSIATLHGELNDMHALSLSMQVMYTHFFIFVKKCLNSLSMQ